ncbi:hypothetical protein PHYC_00586 [Phycisphaerales bacterium]|nr:hypothetical protein PHYC_00586 [Phycisphaerales bacterium]
MKLVRAGPFAAHFGDLERTLFMRNYDNREQGERTAERIEDRDWRERNQGGRFDWDSRRGWESQDRYGARYPSEGDVGYARPGSESRPRDYDDGRYPSRSGNGPGGYGQGRFGESWGGTSGGAIGQGSGYGQSAQGQGTGYGQSYYYPSQGGTYGPARPWNEQNWRGQEYGEQYGGYQQGAQRGPGHWSADQGGFGEWGDARGGYPDYSQESRQRGGMARFGTIGDRSSQETWGRSAQRRRGTAPKGYKRSDDRIQEDVCERIMDDGIDAGEVDVKVKEAVVVLTGEVEDRRDKHRIEQIAAEVSGVQDVENQVRIKKADSSRSERSSTGASGNAQSSGSPGSQQKTGAGARRE